MKSGAVRLIDETFGDQPLLDTDALGAEVPAVLSQLEGEPPSPGKPGQAREALPGPITQVSGHVVDIGHTATQTAEAGMAAPEAGEDTLHVVGSVVADVGK